MSAAFTTLKLHQKGGENLKTKKETGTTQEEIYWNGVLGNQEEHIIR